MIEWLVMLFQNKNYRPTDDNIKPIMNTYEQINQIEEIIDTKENSLKNDRDEIEKQLMQQKRDFQVQLDQTKAEVEFFYTAEAIRRAQEFKDKIAQIIDRIKYLQEELGRIHAQETDLEMMQGEYPILDTLKDDIKPYRELWDLRVEYDLRIKEWQHGPLKNLVPDEVESQHSKMRTTSMKLANIFEQKKAKQPLGVAKKMQRDLADFKEYVPIIRALCNEGLQERHINVIFQKMTIQPDQKLEQMSIKKL